MENKTLYDWYLEEGWELIECIHCDSREVVLEPYSGEYYCLDHLKNEDLDSEESKLTLEERNK